MGKKTERTGIVFLVDQMDLANRLLNDEERGRLYRALQMYSMEKKWPSMERETEVWKGIFDIMRVTQDKWIKQYEDKCEQNRQKMLRRWHGTTAGIPQYTDATYKIKEKQIKEKQINSGDAPSLEGQEGVTSDESGFVWW